MIHTCIGTTTKSRNLLQQTGFVVEWNLRNSHDSLRRTRSEFSLPRKTDKSSGRVWTVPTCIELASIIYYFNSSAGTRMFPGPRLRAAGKGVAKYAHWPSLFPLCMFSVSFVCPRPFLFPVEVQTELYVNCAICPGCRPAAQGTAVYEWLESPSLAEPGFGKWCVWIGPDKFYCRARRADKRRQNLVRGNRGEKCWLFVDSCAREDGGELVVTDNG